MVNNYDFNLRKFMIFIVIPLCVFIIFISIILKIVNNVKISNVSKKTLAFIEMVEDEFSSMSSNGKDIPKGVVTIDTLKYTYAIDISDNFDDEGWIEVKSGKVTDYSLKIGKYVVDNDNGKPKVTKKGTIRDVEEDNVNTTQTKNTKNNSKNSKTKDTKNEETEETTDEEEKKENENSTSENTVENSTVTESTETQGEQNINNDVPEENNTPTVPNEPLGKPTKVPAVNGETHKGIIYLDPTNLNYECTASNSTIGSDLVGCMKWYIIDDSGDSYTMILDHNIIPQFQYSLYDNNYAYENSEVKHELESFISFLGWKMSARIISANEVANLTQNGSFDPTSSDNWYYFDSKTQTQSATTQGASNYAWLFDYTNNCTSYGCNVSAGNTNGYWTSTPIVKEGVDTNIWIVGYDGSFGFINMKMPSYVGVRPVITIPKSQVA